MSFRVGQHELGIDSCYIIAEIGSNHDNIKTRAFEMIRRVASTGANAVKFQLFSADRIAASIDLPEARLNDSFSKFGKTVHDLYKHIELPVSWLKELKACADENEVHFLATPFDETAADLLAELGVPAMKVASFEITHIPFLRHLGKLGIPVLLSTGMANLGEIEMAIDAVQQAGEGRIALFHCGIGYPTPFESVNLRCMETMRMAFDCPIGYSDHTEGISVPIAAAALGASLFEKHVTFEGGQSPDHHFSLEMGEFETMVTDMRQCERALGNSTKKPMESEQEHLLRGRRSLFVVRDMKEGDTFTCDNISVLRPGIGMAPLHYDHIIGKRASRNLKSVHVLEEGDFC